MALRLRRGTDAERQLITPLEGELIWTTDTRELYAGDGSTAGGIKITGADDAPRTELGELDDVTLGTINDGDLLAYDNTLGTWTAVEPTAPDLIQGENYNIGILGDDSSILVNTTNNFFTGNLDGDIYDSDGLRLWDSDGGFVFAKDGSGLIDLNTKGIDADLRGNIQGSVFNNDLTQILVDHDNETFYGTLNGDVIGSVFSDDSTLLVDAINQTVNANTVAATDYTAPGGQPVVFSNSDVYMQATENFLNLRLIKESTSDLTGDTGTYGKIDFSRNDINGAELVSEIWGGGDGYFYFTADENGLPSARGAEVTMTWKNGQLGLGTYTPSAVLDVQGEITSTSFVQFGSLTSIERDALTAANGMVIYNSTANRFQGYQNGAWINLDDGTAG